MQKIRAKGAQSCLHLHNTSDELFWDVKDLSLVESHVDDSFYQSKRTRDRLEATDKSLKASIAVTDYDQLIKNNVKATSKQEINEININEQLAETWTAITKKQLDPTVFIETPEQIKKRLADIIGF